MPNAKRWTSIEDEQLEALFRELSPGEKEVYVCVTHQVLHMVKVLTEAYRETPYGKGAADNWMFYHDALSTMVCKQCQDWMRDIGILKWWLLPAHGCNEGTRWESSPLGNQHITNNAMGLSWEQVCGRLGCTTHRCDASLATHGLQRTWAARPRGTVPTPTQVLAHLTKAARPLLSPHHGPAHRGLANATGAAYRPQQMLGAKHSHDMGRVGSDGL